MRRPDGEPWTLDTFAAGVETDAVWSVVHPSELSPDQRFDAEYYKPEYLRLDTLLTGLAVRTLSELDGGFVVGPFGSSFTADNYVEASPYRYIRGRDVKPFFLLADENVYVAKTDFNRLIKHRLRAGDLLISVVGTLGNVAVVDEDLGEAIFSCKSTVYRPRSFNPYYLCTYLNSEVGQAYLKRRPRGTIQTGLNLSDLKSIPIYVPDEEEQAAIGELVKSSRNLLRRADRLYADAEGCLPAELGLSDLDLSYQPTYTRNFAHAWAGGRLDAEYFQPRHYTLLRRIRDSRYGAAALLAKTRFVRDYAHIDPTKTYRYVQLADINRSIGTVAQAGQYRGDELPSRARLLLRSGDVLVSTVQGSLDKVALIPEHLDGALASTGFFQFRQFQYPAEVLLVLFSSTILRWQLHRHARGSILRATAAAALQQVLVPEIPDHLQAKIAAFVRQSHKAFADAKRLLDEAKRRVEQMILAGRNP